MFMCMSTLHRAVLKEQSEEEEEILSVSWVRQVLNDQLNISGSAA